MRLPFSSLLAGGMLALSGCAAVDPLGEAPPSSAAPVRPPDEVRAAAGEAPNAGGPAADPGKAYSLPELVDLAERTNPATRKAWENARAAAVAVGLHQAAYYPVLSLLASGGTNSLDTKVGGVPAPLDEPSIDADFGAAGLYLNWLLYDFGAREADVAEAMHARTAATMAFNAAHQKVVFGVQRAYYALCAERGRLAVAKANLDSVRAVEEATAARLEHGTSTTPDLLLAKERTAQANYDSVVAEAGDELAYADLCQAVGIPPTVRLKVADMGSEPFPARLEQSVEKATDEALHARPDLMAALAEVRAKDAALRKAQADLLPKIGLSALAARSYATATAYPIPVNDADLTIDTYIVELKAQWALFDGFSNVNKIKLARAERGAAEADLAAARLEASAQVFQAYTRLKTALRKGEVSRALVEASQKAYDAAMEAYGRGLRTVLDTLSSERDLRAARETDVATRAEVYTAWQALAYATGKTRGAIPLSEPESEPATP